MRDFTSQNEEEFETVKNRKLSDLNTEWRFDLKLPKDTGISTLFDRWPAILIGKLRWRQEEPWFFGGIPSLSDLHPRKINICHRNWQHPSCSEAALYILYALWQEHDSSWVSRTTNDSIVRYMELFINGGTQKWMVFVRENPLSRNGW